jgi:uncharacterized BrkB/YihY/UPF0761 family membrane protein
MLGKNLTPWLHHAITLIYWPIAVLVALALLTSLYHLSVPHRRRWRSALPGAIFAMLIWAIGSWGLRKYVAFVFSRTIAYGTLGAPVAVLLFLYVTALAVLLGAELNATIDLKREELARADAEYSALTQVLESEPAIEVVTEPGVVDSAANGSSTKRPNLIKPTNVIAPRIKKSSGKG